MKRNNFFSTPRPLVRTLGGLWSLLWCWSLVFWPGGEGCAQDFMRLAPPVAIGERQLSNPWGGGLNNPQVSAADLNRDGVEDLYVFDRAGNVHQAYLNLQGRYVFAPEYVANFPTLENWCLLRDYNNDGIADIFAYSDIIGIDGITVYTGYWLNDRLAFRRFRFRNAFNLLGYPLSTGTPVNLYVTGIDLPAIDDLDCDGDLDIATFNLGGGYVEMYRNWSIESGFRRDSLVFRLQDGCWGGFYESGLSNAVSLASAPGQCFRQAAGELAVNFRHSGSTLLTFDADNDGDRELILGDISFNNLNYLRNAGSCQQAWMDQQDQLFPKNDQPVELPTFPAAFFLDVTGDGKKDLLAAPNADQASEDREVLWVYENIGSANNASFRYRRSDFLVGDMIDLGSGANPTIVDVNADGLLDLVVGNFTYYQADGTRDPRLFLFLNEGTATQPRFRLVDDNWLDMMQFNRSVYSFSPAFGDLDGDQDLDLVVGEEFGQLFFAENLAGPGQPMRFAPFIYPYAGIDVGQASVPQLADLNGDGLVDLIVGERTGNLNYFQNQGTSAQPRFNADARQAPNSDRLGLVDTRKDFPIGHSAPLLFQQNGRWELLAGSESGNLFYYQNLEGRLASGFTLSSAAWGGLNDGKRCRPALADINADGKLDLLLGNTRGGMSWYTTSLRAGTSTAVRNLPTAEPLQGFPNPTSGHYTLQLPLDLGAAGAWLTVWDLQGRVVHQQTLAGGTTHLAVQDWPAGLYTVQVRAASRWWVGKIAKTNP